MARNGWFLSFTVFWECDSDFQRRVFVEWFQMVNNSADALVTPKRYPIGYAVSLNKWVCSDHNYLVGGLEHFYFSIQFGMPSSQLTFKFFSEG